MKLLIIGGTQFVGRAMVEVAIERGHELTVFHRGKTNPGLFGSQVEELIGDRKEDLSALSGRSWDAVVDCVGYEPGVVSKSCREIKADAYVFVSSISVYGVVGATETTPTLPLLPGTSLEGVTTESYGPLKVLCEEEIESAFPGRALILRAGLQIGPHDHTDRFNDWIDRMLHRQKVVVPDDDMPCQLIDARDMAVFAFTCLEKQLFGVFNVTGHNMTLGHTLERAREALGLSCELVKVSPELIKLYAEPWKEVPLWFPSAERGDSPLDVHIGKALAAGLELRPLGATLEDIRKAILAWPSDRPRRGGLPQPKEDQILSVWDAQQG